MDEYGAWKNYLKTFFYEYKKCVSLKWVYYTFSPEMFHWKR